MAHFLQFTFYGQDDPQVQLLNYLRRKHMLLILDNFEHLLAATPFNDIHLGLPKPT